MASLRTLPALSKFIHALERSWARKLSTDIQIVPDPLVMQRAPLVLSDFWQNNLIFVVTNWKVFLQKYNENESMSSSVKQ